MEKKKKEIDPQIKQVLEKIGEQVKVLRKNHGKKNYISFAKDDLVMNKNTYLKIENGTGDYNIGKLIKIMSRYPDVKLSKIFKKAGL
jgi:hypothetical protein